MDSEVKQWVEKCLREDRASYGRDTGLRYHGDTLGISHFIIAAYSTLNDHAREQALYEYLQQTLEAEFPDCTYEECFRFPGAGWETLSLTLDSSNESACEMAMDLLVNFEGNEPLFCKLEEKYELEEAILSIRAYKPDNMAAKLPSDWERQIDTYLSQVGEPLSRESVEAAARALNFMSEIYCPKGHRYQSTDYDHWTEMVTIDDSLEAIEGYEQWVQQKKGAQLTMSLPGFPRTGIPYPVRRDGYGDPAVIQIDEDTYICPHCGAKMKEIK